MYKLIQRGAIMCLLTLSAVLVPGSAGAGMKCTGFEECDFGCDVVEDADGSPRIVCWRICTCHE